MKKINELKTSFAPISFKDTRILILGSLPGEKSLELGQYYAHPRNRFWPVLAAITGSNLPKNYEAKIKLLKQHGIGLWDVVRTARRIGSLDTNILEDIPNDLESFLQNHPHLQVIGFNGTKSLKLFEKYFTRQPKLKYLALPSTSPANASFTLEKLSEKWQQMFNWDTD